MDGQSKTPYEWSGEIGKRIKNCETLEIFEEFRSVEYNCNVSKLDEIAEYLNTDQKYLFKICKAISEGCVTGDWVNHSIGPVNHSRWITTASRFLRLYISEPNPSIAFCEIVQYIISVYAPMVFELKHRPSIVYGPIHLARTIERSKSLSLENQRIVEDSINENSYFAHPENVMLSILNDDNQEVRLEGWKKILHARESRLSSDPIRVFKKPTINYACSSYMDIVDLNNATDDDPPILCDVKVYQENIDFLSCAKKTEQEFGRFLIDMPIHTQSVERCVKVVTEVSMKICGPNARNGMIANIIASKNDMSQFNS